MNLITEYLSVKSRTKLKTWVVLACVLAPGVGQAAPDSSEAEELNQCRENLKSVYDAIQAYRKTHKDLPENLSSLVPQFLSDPKVLRCPACVRLHITSNDIMKSVEEPDNRVTYTYEFWPAPIPPNIAGGSPRTMRDWKRLQMSLVGSDVPMVRCHCHSRSLNLSFGGRIFESPPDWEDMFLDVVQFEDLTFARLFANYTVFEVIRIPARTPETPPHLIDLSDYYNASLQKGWHSENVKNNLARLPSGIVEFAGIRFDVRGVIQLTGKKRYALMGYPSEVSGIPIGMQSRTFYFVHATAFPVNNDMHIANYVFHYADGKTAQFPILYGRHVLDWWSDPNKPGRFNPAEDQSRVIWSGTNDAREAEGKGIYLYLSVWQNPHPNLEIKSMDYISTMEPSAPFLIAVTAEPLEK